MQPLPTHNGLVFDAGLALYCATLADTAYDKPDFMCRNIAATVTEYRGLQLFIFAGSNDCEDWLEDFDILPVERGDMGLVPKGFADMWDTCRDPLSALMKSSPLPKAFGGHSAGAALALYGSTYAKKVLGISPQWVYTQGSPRPLFSSSLVACMSFKIPQFNVINGHDMVPDQPFMGDFHRYGADVYLDLGGNILPGRMPGHGELIMRGVDCVEDHLLDKASGYISTLTKLVGNLKP